ncbi:hypothetical protein DICPUDRAFT_33993, partial [Dictyostelium purpureum]
MHRVREIQGINQKELSLNINDNASWHADYSHSPYIYVGGLNFDLTEGDIISIFSQYGEISECNLVRNKETGKSQGFCFIGYDNQKSTVLAVDNFNGIKVLGKTIKVDHVKDYKRPKKNNED